MSPRPRTIDDREILDAAFRAISQLGPARLTLAHVAREAGLAPATLVQRFGSKRGLLLAVAAQGVEDVGTTFDEARRRHDSPRAALVAAATAMTREIRSPEELAHALAFRQMDVGDAEFHRLALQHARRTLAGYRTLLDDAVAAGELRRCDTGRLARAIAALAGGSLIGWAIHREGSAESWLRQDIDTLLAPYAIEAPPPPRRGTGRRSRPGALPARRLTPRARD